MVDPKIFLGLVMPNQYCHIVNIKLVSGVAFLGKKPLTPDPYIQYNFTIWQISLMTNLQVCANKISRILAAYYFSKELLSMDLYVEVPSLQEWFNRVYLQYQSSLFWYAVDDVLTIVALTLILANVITWWQHMTSRTGGEVQMEIWDFILWLYQNDD